MNAGFNVDSGRLSTGANVSRTMDSLNAENNPTYGSMSFAKRSFDKIEPGTGDIILGGSNTTRPKRGLFGGFGRKKNATPSGWDMNAPATPQGQGASAPTGSPAGYPSEPAFTTNRSGTAYVPSEFQNPAPEKNKSVVNKKLLIILAVVVVLVIGGVGAYFLITQNTEKNSSNNQNNQNTTNTVAARDAYLSLANYIVFGSEDVDSMKTTDGTELNLYDILNLANTIDFADSVFYANKELKEDNSPEKESYLAYLSELCDDLSLADDGHYREESEAIKAYYKIRDDSIDIDRALGTEALSALKKLYEDFYDSNENNSDTSSGESQ